MEHASGKILNRHFQRPDWDRGSSVQDSRILTLTALESWVKADILRIAKITLGLKRARSMLRTCDTPYS